MSQETWQQHYTQLKTKISSLYNSNNLLFITTSCIVTLTATFGVRKFADILYRKWYNYPPGPIGLPFIGCLLWIRDKQYLQSLANCYGSVVMIQVGTKYLTMINEYNLSKQLFKKKEFSFHKINPSPPIQYKSLVDSNGKQYTFRRKLIHHSFIMMVSSDYLNNIGIKMLHNYIYPKFDEFALNQNKSHSIKKIFEYGVFTMNFVCIFGEYLDPPSIDSSEYTLILNAVSRKSLALSGLLNEIIPSSKTNSLNITPNLFKYLSNLPQETHQLLFIQHIFRKWVTEFEQRYNNEYKKDDDMDNKPYIIRMWKQIKLNKLTINDLIGEIAMLFSTGVGTTNKALTRIIIYAAKYEELQNKIYHELVQYVEEYGSFKLEHLSELHYLRAFIYEVLRNGHIIWAVPRIIYDDNVNINNYNIPKQSLISAYYGYMDHSHKHWKYPHNFDIRNFLNENNKFENNPYFSVFGHGIRSCPGKGLAKRELLLFIGMVLLRYKLSINDNNCKNLKIDYFSQHTLTVYDTKIMVQLRT